MVYHLLKKLYKHLPLSIRRLFFFGNKHYCPVCQSSLREFKTGGTIPRPHALCPICGALERHRMVWTFFQKQTTLFASPAKRMLHIAPEPIFEQKFKKNPFLEYITADLFSPNVMITMDITNIQYPNESFDIIYCSHVLEHVVEDQKAMSELQRILTDTGWMVIQVPITVNKTFEDFSIVTPEERKKVFGQEDHVRCYGPDIVERLQKANLQVRIITPEELAEKNNLFYMGIPKNEIVFFCKKNIS